MRMRLDARALKASCGELILIAEIEIVNNMARRRKGVMHTNAQLLGENTDLIRNMIRWLDRLSNEMIIDDENALNSHVFSFI